MANKVCSSSYLLICKTAKITSTEKQKKYKLGAFNNIIAKVAISKDMRAKIVLGVLLHKNEYPKVIRDDNIAKDVAIELLKKMFAISKNSKQEKATKTMGCLYAALITFYTLSINLR